MATKEKGRAAVRMGLATLGFALVHSALASRAAKRTAARVLGERPSGAVYRLLYNAQAAATLGALLLYGARLPAHTVYRVRGPGAALLRAGQAAGLVWAGAAAREVGVARLVGLSNLWAWMRGRELPPGPAAQGPEGDARGRLRVDGPFLLTRHPLNLAPLPVFWLTPHLTTRRLAFNLVGTAYMVIGSLHEEARLRDTYGEEYERYRRSGIPFYLPRPGRGALRG